MDIIDQQKDGQQDYLTADEVIAKTYSFQFSAYFNQAVEILKNNIGSFAIATLVMFALQFVIGLIPFVGSIAGIFLTPGLYGGFLLMSKNASEGGKPEVGDLFSGFKGQYYSKMLATYLLTIVVTLIPVIIAIPFVIAAGPQLDAFNFGPGTSPDEMSELFENGISGMFSNPSALWGLSIVALLLIFLSICMALSFSFALFTPAGPWESITSSFRIVKTNWFWFFLYAVVLGICALLGLIALCIGFLFTYPIMLIGLFTAFDHIMKGKSSAN